MDPAPNISPNEPFNSSEPDRGHVTTATEPIAAGEKRAGDNGICEDVAVKSPKRARRTEASAKRVAEIVLTLSAMCNMRGGREPTAAEVRLMAEAREKLAQMCEGLAPKDIVARDAISGLIEDLGLNGRAKEQRLGFRGQRLSIKEKFELSKKKMEESKKFATQASSYTSHPLQASFGSAAENRGTSHVVRVFPSDKATSSATVSSGGFLAATPSVHVSAANSTSLPYQLPNNDIKAPTVSSGLPSSHLGRDLPSSAQARVERPQFKLDGAPNGSSYVMQANAPANHSLVTSSGNHPLVNPSTWSVQPQSVPLAKPSQENKLPNHNFISAPQAARDQNFRPFMSQTTAPNLPTVHQTSQGINPFQAPQFGNNHNEISKVVQKLLHPKAPEHPMWTPPSRDYMNKALTCQICKMTVNEVETVVLCDACEKGYHLKCLQMNNQKGIPRGGEWHCMSCLKLSHGKPLPPKYGRVMRSVNTPKLPSNPIMVQSSSDKKLGSVDQNVNHAKITVNGSSFASGTMASNSMEFASGTKFQNATAMQGNNLLSSKKDIDQKSPFGTCQNNSAKPNVGPSGKRLAEAINVCQSTAHEEKQTSESQTQRPAISPEKVSNNSNQLQGSNDSQVAPAELPNRTEDSLSKTHENDKTAKQNEDIQLPNPAGNSSDVPCNVEWVGDVFQIVDEKKIYKSCCIGGVTYKVQDHALFQFSNDRLIPYKLKAMWEDSKTGSKLCTVNRCFFPGDLPGAVGCPCSPECNELYESNNESTVAAGLIKGPCEVLPPTKFKEANEKRNDLGTEASKGSHPLFLCKWFYDEVKGVFRPVSG